MAYTLYDKIWRDHKVCALSDNSDLLYIDKQLLHEVTSPQAFSGLRSANRSLWRKQANLATVDHNIPTTNQQLGVDAITNITSKKQVQALEKNCQDFGVTSHLLGDPKQGIVHVMAPEQGATLPGMTLVCGDSHTSTHGAFGAIAFGIGTSEVEQVLATQCLPQKKSKNMRVHFIGSLPKWVTAKDMILRLIAQIGTAGGVGHAIEYAGDAVSKLSMEARMTLCNMTIEAGARCGLIACDETTLDYIKGRPLAPTGKNWQAALTYWQTLKSDANAHFDSHIEVALDTIKPQVSWGTSPEMVANVDATTPQLSEAKSEAQRQSWQQALDYMGLKEGMAITDIALDRVFIGSCTNARIEDLRAAASVIETTGKHVAKNIIQALVVPGSGLVKAQAEKEGLHETFIKAGFEWRQPGCSMCLAMNNDRLKPQEHCASTSNRNFEGRQGRGGRTHLVSPAMATAAALHGHFVDISTL